MSHTASAPPVPPATAALDLSVQPAGSAPLSAAARAFNLQLQRIDKLKSQLGALDAMAQAHRAAVHRELTPLHKRHREAGRDMALLLASHVEDKALSVLQRETARQIVCGLARALAQDGDVQMAALHDRYSAVSLAERSLVQTAELRARLEAALGAPLDDVPADASHDEVLAAGMARLSQSMRAEQARRRDTAARRKAKKQAGQARVEAELADADTSLRQLFRQLASALHPDRESDPTQRQRKTALMSEANAAYERRDLVALLQVQQRALLADPLAAARQSEDKLAGLTRLLKAQVADLERERAGLHDRLAAEFEVPGGLVVTPRTLQGLLAERVDERHAALVQMAHDREQVQTVAGLKRWLNAQRAEPRSAACAHVDSDAFH